MVAYGLAQRRDLLLLAQSVQDPNDLDDKKRLDEVAKQAKDFARAGAAANTGTALHRFTELVDLGLAPKVPDDYAADIRAYRSKMKELGVEILETEQIVVNTEIGVAGTFDRLVTLNGFDLPVILDIKTGRTVDFSHLEHAVQLGIYANAPHRFDVETGEVGPTRKVEKSVALIVHLPAGKGECSVHAINVEKGWRLAKVAADVYAARKDKTLSVPFELRAA